MLHHFARSFARTAAIAASTAATRRVPLTRVVTVGSAALAVALAIAADERTDSREAKCDQKRPEPRMGLALLGSKRDIRGHYALLTEIGRGGACASEHERVGRSSICVV